MKIKLRSVGFCLAILVLFFMVLLCELNLIIFFKFILNKNYFPDSVSDNKLFSVVWYGFNLSPSWVSYWFFNPYNVNLDLTKFSIFFNIFMSIIYIFSMIIFASMIFKNKYYFATLIMAIIFIFFMPYGFILSPLFIIILLIFYFNPVNLNDEFIQKIHDSFTSKKK